MFAAIASFINKILALIDNITRASTFVSNPLGGILGGETAEQTVPTESTETTPQAQPQPQTTIPSGKRAQITIPERITAHFADTNSPAWKNQNGPLGIGHHYGTDFGGTNGSPVFAPYAMHIVAIGNYSDEGRKGDYVIGTLDNGTEYYSGHLSDVKVKVGDYVKSGQQIAQIGYYNHTHIQLRVRGVLTDFEVYEKQ